MKFAPTAVVEGMHQGVVNLVNTFYSTGRSLRALDQSGGLRDRLDVDNHIDSRSDLCDLLFDLFCDVVGAFERCRPPGRDGYVRKKPPLRPAHAHPSGFLHAGGPIRRRGEVRNRNVGRSVHQYVDGPLAEPGGRDQHGGPNEDPPNSVRALDAGAHQKKGDERNERSADVGNQVQGSGAECIGVVGPGGAQQHTDTEHVDQSGRAQQRQRVLGSVNRRGGGRCKPADGIHDDSHNDDPQEQSLGERDEVLGFGMAVVMFGIGGFAGHPHTEEHQPERHDVDHRIEGLREDYETRGGRPHRDFCRRQDTGHRKGDQGGTLAAGSGHKRRVRTRVQQVS